MAETSAESLFTFKNSDVHIKVTYQDKLVLGKVCSHGIALVSRPWENFMFDPRNQLDLQVNDRSDPEPLRHSTPSDCSTYDEQYTLTFSPQGNTTKAPVEKVNFTEDDGEALLILLRIAHLQFDKVPATITYNTFLHLSILCDQYDCVCLVGPWLPRWLPEHESSALDIGHELVLDFVDFRQQRDLRKSCEQDGPYHAN